jgi:hypothetical protein
VEQPTKFEIFNKANHMLDDPWMIAVRAMKYGLCAKTTVAQQGSTSASGLVCLYRCGILR